MIGSSKSEFNQYKLNNKKVGTRYYSVNRNTQYNIIKLTLLQLIRIDLMSTSDIGLLLREVTSININHTCPPIDIYL